MGMYDNDEILDDPMEMKFRETEKRRFKGWLKDLSGDEFSFVEEAVEDEIKQREEEAARDQHLEDEGDALRSH